MKNKKDKKEQQFPNKNRLKEVEKRLSSSEILGSSLLPENATQVDCTKYKACEMIIRFRYATGLKQKELATRLDIDEARMSEILHYKIDGFTLDRLIGYAQVLHPNLRVSLELVAA